MPCRLRCSPGLAVLLLTVVRVEAGGSGEKPRVYLREIEPLLHRETGDLDMTALWAKLGIGVSKPYLFGYKGTAGERCVLEKNCWKCRIFESGRTKHHGYNTLKVLLISHGAWCQRQYLVFEKDERVWIYRGHVDLYTERGDLKSDLEFHSRRNGPLLFSLNATNVTGTGILAFDRVFYRLVDGKVKRVLSFLSKGYITGWGTNRWKKYEAVVWPDVYPRPEDGIGMTFFIAYQSYGRELGPYSERTEEPPYLFSVKRDVYFVWNSVRKAYVADPTVYKGDPRHYEVMGLLSHEKFQEEYGSEIQRLWKHGTASQRRWVLWFRTKLEDDRKSAAEGLEKEKDKKKAEKPSS